MKSGMIAFFALLVLLTEMAMGSKPSMPQVGQVFAKHGVHWGYLANYHGRYTVQGILHRSFSHGDWRQMLSKLGFRSGIIPTHLMLYSLQQAVANDPDDYQEPLRRLAISTRVERALSELNETIISSDESLSSSQKLTLTRVLALMESYAVNSPDTMDIAIKAIKDCDRLTLSNLLDNGELNPNLPIVSGMPLIGFAIRSLSTLEEQLVLNTSIDQQKLDKIRKKIDDSIDQLKWLAHHPRVNLDATDSKGRTFIGMAAKEGTFNALKIALSRGMSVDSVDGIGNTPLLTHLIFGLNSDGLWVETMKFLVEEANAGINVSNDNGTTPLHMVVAYERKWGGTDEYFFNKGGFRNPTTLSSLRGTELTEYFLDRGADINAENIYGRPLDLAQRGDNRDLVDLLIKHGGEVKK